LTSKPPAPKAVLSTEEVLEYLQVNLRTAYRLIKNQSSPAVRMGRQSRELPIIIIITGVQAAAKALGPAA
jgi:excisionase family DNA binding protein